jgi:hypothetical protein
VAEERGHFGNSEDRESKPLEAVTRGLATTQLIKQTQICALVNFRLCRSMKTVSVA